MGSHEKKGKPIIKILVILVIIAIIAVACFLAYKFLFKHDDNNKNNDETVAAVATDVEDENEVKEIVDIVDLNSTSRPFAITVNNTPVAVKVQEGLNKAYLVYEIPTEGGTSRLLALFKDVDDVTVGTIRSARHNFIDYALESNAIFVAYGWSHYAQDDLQKSRAIDYIQGLFDTPFWRNNPEGLASEHTAYTSIAKLRENATSKNYNLDSSSVENTILLNYNVSDVDLSSKDDSEIANSVTIPYGAGFKTEFKYDEGTKEYKRYENGAANVDHATGEQFTAKNIIVQKITYSTCSDGYYWDLNTTGSGNGYFITNGYAVPIKWSKSSRSAKTKYTYLDGTEIEVSDGRTYIEVQTTSQTLTIE